MKAEKDEFEAELAKNEESTADTLEKIKKNKFKIAALKKDKIDVSKNVKNMRKEKETMMAKI